MKIGVDPSGEGGLGVRSLWRTGRRLAAIAGVSTMLVWGAPAWAQQRAADPARADAEALAPRADIGVPAGWVETAAGVDFGLADFEFRGGRREWNVGIGRSVGPRLGQRWSFLGGGVEVSRPSGGKHSAEEQSPLQGLEVRPWVGGCVVCPVGRRLTLGVELKWAPESAVIVRDDDRGSEGRAGVSLGIRW